MQDISSVAKSCSDTRLEERDRRVGLEPEKSHNFLGDRFAASDIDSKGDKLQEKKRGLEDFMAEHRRILETLSDEYGSVLTDRTARGKLICSPVV